MSLINKGPSVFSLENDTQAINIINRISGNSYDNISDAIAWVKTQNDMVILGKTIENYVTDGLSLHLDATDVESYPKSGSSWYDLSNNSHTATLVGASYSGGDIAFDGVDDYVDLGQTFTLHGTASSLSVWVRITDFNPTSPKTQPARYLTLHDNISNDYRNLIAFWDGEYGYENDSNSDPYEVNSDVDGPVVANDIKPQTWFNFSLVFLNGVSYGYVNGELISSIAINSDLLIRYIGRAGASTNYPDFLKGKVNNLMIYQNKALTEEEVVQNYYAGRTKYRLVFGFDLGDNLNYLGEPTINLNDDPYITAFNTSGATITNYSDYTEIVASDSTMWSGVYKTFNFTSGVTYTLSYWYKYVSGSTKVGGHVVDNVGSQIRIDKGTWVGGNITDIITDNEYHLVEVRYTATSSSSGTWWIQPGRSEAITTICHVRTGNDYGVQIEANNHSTNFTETSRTNTNSLLDLTGNGTIDISNVSYTEESLMVYDGTDDYTTFDTVTFSITEPWSYTIVLNPYDGMIDAWKNIIGQLADTNCTWMFHSAMGLGIYQAYYNSQTYIWWANLKPGVSLDTNVYSHITITCEPVDPDTTKFTSYLNGVLVNQSNLTWAAINRIQTFNRVGGNGSRFYEGEVGYVKIYNVVLSQQEVSYEYDVLKTRFNLG